MRLSEALQIITRTGQGDALSVQLLCGSMPLHVTAFLRARLQLRFPDARVQVTSGLFGDLDGNIARASGTASDGAVTLVEWSDLDPRLGFRASARWSSDALADIAVQIAERCERLEQRLLDLSRTMPVVVVGPGLPLPQLPPTPPTRSSQFELQIDARVGDLLRRLAAIDAVCVVNNRLLASLSPPDARYDFAADLRTGFPYTLSHADTLADVAVQCLFPDSPRKGLITDLDGTLWKGVLGDVGVDGVSWSLDDKSHQHGLYQLLLGSLANSGILLAIASKNDPEPVAAALHRSDLLVSPGEFFPIEASWGAKSAAVGRILERWNVGADSVLFIDDSLMELAEVSEAHPGIECLQFPADAGCVPALLRHLRTRFGKPHVLPEDLIRQSSIRASHPPADVTDRSPASGFQERLDATITVAAGASDGRALELVNKSNQFNLNGDRYTESAWRALSQRERAFVATLAYDDRFGPLGRIAVLAGQVRGDVCDVDVWVMSCRAFSRDIEFQAVRHLFDKTAATTLRFRYKATDRNGPMQAFLARIGTTLADDGALTLDAELFKSRCPLLFHKVNDTWTMSETS